MMITNSGAQEESAAGVQYLALQALRELDDDILEVIGEEGPSAGHGYGHVELFERAIRKRNYTLRELMEIQVILACRSLAVARTIRGLQTNHRYQGDI